MMNVKELIEKYPFLLPRNVWTDKLDDNYDYSYCWFKDDIPEGWWKFFGLAYLDDLKEVLEKNDFLDKFRFSQVKEKLGCYDEQTEVLTLNGWKFFRELTYDDKILTLNKELNQMEYQSPTDIISYNYNGNMYKLVNRGIDILVTPNHNLFVSPMPAWRGKKGNFKKLKPSYTLQTPDKLFGKSKRFMKGGVNYTQPEISDLFYIPDYHYQNYTPATGIRKYTKKCHPINLENFIKFLGFFVAEGCVIHKKNGKLGEICISFNPQKECDLVLELIEGIGFTPSNLQKGVSEGVFRFSNSALSHWLSDNCGYMAYGKRVPNFIKELPSKYIKLFLDYLYMGDGHKADTSYILTTTSKQLANDVEELLLKAGYCFRTFERFRNKKADFTKKQRFIEYKHKVYEINWLKNNFIEVDMSKFKNTPSCVEEWVEYSGMVYCVTVPNHIIYIKRNGKGVWCGNSIRAYHNGAPEEWFSHEYAWEYISEHTCVNCGKFPVKMRDDGWMYPLCDECFREAHSNLNDDEFKKYSEKWTIDKDSRLQEYLVINHFSKDGDYQELIDMKPYYEKLGWNFTKEDLISVEEFKSMLER